MSNKEVRFTPAHELRMLNNDSGQRTISGYAIMYGQRSQDLGGFYEVVAPTALNDTLRNNPDVFAFYNHDTRAIPLGRTTSGTLKLVNDSVGLQFRCTLPDTTLANDLAVSIDRGDVSGVSFGFATDEDQWTKANGVITRTLKQISLFEISPTPMPAYTQTHVDIRSCPAEMRSHITLPLTEHDIAKMHMRLALTQRS